MKKITALFLSLLMLLSLCACGSVNRQARSAPAAYESSFYAESPVAQEAAASYDMAGLSSANTAAARGGAEKEVPAESAPEERADKILYSADVTVETTDFDAALGQVAELVERFGGWIESSSINGSNYYDLSRGHSSARSAGYTLRIPGDRFQELMGSLTELGNVPYTHLYTENVTAQYYDTEARMTAYQAQETRLLEMMEVAESVEDIILLEDRLTELRWRIESLQSTLKNWDRRVSYSSVYLELREVQEYTPEAVTKISYGQRLWRSLKDGLRGVAEFFEELLLWFVGALPALVILAVLVLLLWKPVRRLFTRSREKRAEKKAARMEKKAPKPDKEEKQ